MPDNGETVDSESVTIRVPVHRLRQLTTILAGLGEVFPEAKDIQEAIALPGAEENDQ